MTTHNPNNERIKRRYFAYLKEAKRQSEPTVDGIAKALDRFEIDTKHRDFKEGAAAGTDVRVARDARRAGVPIARRKPHIHIVPGSQNTCRVMVLLCEMPLTV